MWRDVEDFDGMNFQFATEADAQHALTMLVELFPNLVDVECSGVWSMGKAVQVIS